MNLVVLAVLLLMTKKTKNIDTMKKQIVSEDFGNFLREELEPEIVGNSEEDIPIDISGMPDMEEDDMEDRKDEIRRILKNELLIPEFSRETLLFKLKNSSEVEGVPMAELFSSDSFVVKIQGKNQKIKVEDILDINQIFEEPEEIVNEGYGEYNFADYLYDISNFIEASVPDWNTVLAGEDDQNLVNWLEENQDLWDLQSLFSAGVPSEDAALQILEEFQAANEEE
jgi:hypothetical protein